MPGTYTGEFFSLTAPAVGIHFHRIRGNLPVTEGEIIYLHIGHAAQFENGQYIEYLGNNSDGRPHINLEKTK